MSLTPDGSFRMTPRPCPACGYVMDAAREVVLSGGVASGPPVPGDESVCFGCGAVLVEMAGGVVALEAAEEISAQALEAQTQLLAYKAGGEWYVSGR